MATKPNPFAAAKAAPFPAKGKAPAFKPCAGCKSGAKCKAAAKCMAKK